MTKNLFYSCLLLLSLTLFCCSTQETEETKILARINDYNLTLDSFEYQLATELELDEDFKLTNQAKRNFLEEIMRKQLLIQEAKKLKLDTKDEFIRAIQRYWESTLIINLIDLKSQEINKKTYVSQEEIETRYKEMVKSAETPPPLKEIQETIKKELKEEKKTRILKEWIDDLRQNAKIEINEELL